MKKSLLKACLALVAMLCSVISANAENTPTGVDPVSGKTYYLYCPASKMYITPADDSFLEEVERYGDIILVTSTANTPSKAWYYKESEGKTTLAGKYGDNDYRYLYGGATLDDMYLNDGIIFQNKVGFGDYTTYFGLGTEEYHVSIEKNGDYYTISSDGYLSIKFGNISKVSETSDYTNFIFVAAEPEPSEEHVHSYQYEIGNNGQHTVTCSGTDCDYQTTEACADNDNDYKCDKCGTNLCQHNGNSVYETSNGVHIIKCSICGEKLGEAACSMEWVSNNDGTHKHQCSVCKNVTESGNCSDGNNDSKCDKCGYGMSQSETPLTGVEPVSGKYYYIYCPALSQYLAAVDKSVEMQDNKPTVPWYWDGNSLSATFDGVNCTLCYYAPGTSKSQFDDNNSNLMFMLLMCYDGMTIPGGAYAAQTYISNPDATIAKNGNYYTINIDNLGYIDGSFAIAVSETSDYTNFIFIEAPAPEAPREEATSYELNISAAKYATFYDSEHAYTMPDGCEGYGWTPNNTLERAYNATEIVPAGEPLVIYSATPGTKTLTFTTSTDESYKSYGINLLEGTDEETPLEEDDNYYFYALTLNADNDLNSVGFYWMNDDGSAFTNGAHRAYLKIAKTAKAPMAFPFNNATAIANAKSSNSNNAAIFNIAGQRLNSLQKGINIVNGKKVLKK